MSIRSRLLLLIVFATLVPALVGGMQFLEHRNSEIASARRDLAASAQRVAEALRDTVRATAQLHYGLSRARDLDTQDRAACSNFLASVLKEHPQYTGILTIKPDGSLFCDSLRTGRKLNLTDRRYFQDALSSGNPLAVEPVFGRLTGSAVLQVAYAARRENGEPALVLLASLDLQKYMRASAKFLPRETAVIALMDGKGTILTWHPDGEKLRGTSIADSPLFRFASERQDGDVRELTEAGGAARIWAVSALPEFPEAALHVLVGVAKKDLLAAANRNLSQDLATLAAVWLLVFAGAWALVELSIRLPVARTIAAVARFSGGDFAARVGSPYPRGELGGLMSSTDHAFQLMQAQREKIERLTRVYAVLSGINALIVRVRDRDELFREACRVAVEAGEFRMAWLGVVDRQAMQVKPVAWQGVGSDYIQLMPLELSDAAPERYGLASRAVNERKSMIVDDMTQDPRILLRKEALERGVRSLALLPLIVAEEAVAVLALYAGEVGFFDEEEMKLLHELAGDIAFALDHIEKANRLDYLAYYDQLTGLANRRLFLERLNQIIHAAGPAGENVALVLADVERLTTVNESLGRQAGDALLKQLAGRLARGADPSELARVGADDFAVVLPSVKGKSEVTRRIERLWHGCFADAFRLGKSEVRISAKAGVALFPDDGADAETLLRGAEAALRKAKRTGERHVFHALEMTAKTAEKLTLENQLRQALERDEFVLHYQPIADLETRRIAGAEALIRWQSPELGLVPPMKFIPLMEETGLILPVGAWALRRASLDHRAWVDQGLKAPRIAVNVSPIQLRQRDFVGIVEQAIIEGVAPTGIDLEITESLIMEDIQGNIEKLKSVRGLGVSIAIDDFGTGYSSLGYLAKLPVQTLKIDRSFIITMLKDPDTMTLVQTIISLAHALRLKVVAEGVDAEDQARILRLVRCDQMQGYLFSRPVPFDQLTALLMQEAESTRTGELT